MSFRFFISKRKTCRSSLFSSKNNFSNSDLLETKPTQRGRLLTKFIGLEVIEKKEEINRELMNNFKSQMKSNVYNTKQLELDTEDNLIGIEENNDNVITFQTHLFFNHTIKLFL